MTHLFGISVLIINCADACELRASLLRAGAAVHVVTRDGALILARSRHIDAAFVGFGVDGDTHRFCEKLTSMHVRQIIVTPGDSTAERAQKERGMILDLFVGSHPNRAIQSSDPLRVCS